jgi:hypothetical protein
MTLVLVTTLSDARSIHLPPPHAQGLGLGERETRSGVVGQSPNWPNGLLEALLGGAAG